MTVMLVLCCTVPAFATPQKALKYDDKKVSEMLSEYFIAYHKADVEKAKSLSGLAGDKTFLDRLSKKLVEKNEVAEYAEVVVESIKPVLPVKLDKKQGMAYRANYYVVKTNKLNLDDGLPVEAFKNSTIIYVKKIAENYKAMGEIEDKSSSSEIAWKDIPSDVKFTFLAAAQEKYGYKRPEITDEEARTAYQKYNESILVYDGEAAKKLNPALNEDYLKSAKVTFDNLKYYKVTPYVSITSFERKDDVLPNKSGIVYHAVCYTAFLADPNDSKNAIFEMRKIDEVVVMGLVDGKVCLTAYYPGQSTDEAIDWNLLPAAQTKAFKELVVKDHGNWYNMPLPLLPEKKSN